MRKASRWQEPLAASRACVLYASIRTQRADETSNEPTPEIARCPVQLEDAILVVLVIPPSGTSCQCLSKRWEQSRITRTTIFPDWSTIQYRMYSSQSGYGFEGQVCEFANESLRNIAWTCWALLDESSKPLFQKLIIEVFKLPWDQFHAELDHSLFGLTSWFGALEDLGNSEWFGMILCLETSILRSSHQRRPCQVYLTVSGLNVSRWEILKTQQVNMLLNTIYCGACFIRRR